MIFAAIFLMYQGFSLYFFSASLFHLALLSAKRYAAMKYSLRYDDVVTPAHMRSAVICSWLIGLITVFDAILTGRQTGLK